MAQGMSAVEHYERGLLLKKVQIFDSALEEFQHAAMDPQQAGKALVQVALCLKSMGRDEEAVTAFRRGLESGSFSSKEQIHIRYLLGQTLEELGREVEALVVYRRIRKEDPTFQDVDSRIAYLTSDGDDPVSSRDPGFHARVRDVLTLWEQLRPQLASLLGKTWESLVRYTDNLEANGGVRSMTCRTRHLDLTPGRCSLSASIGRSVPVDKRRHARVAVQLRSQFSSKNRILAGEGELRDLSPWGCRITSPVGVAIGAALECCIFPQDELNPFTVDEATVRWIRPREFGLAFTKVRPSVQQQIAQMCRIVAPL
ncbi:MAG TPA: PilZ domain-containing protein [Chthoniobacterales bacterium]|nr:PilZ domain-containing protein [Chthoniobacterales bacterium]